MRETVTISLPQAVRRELDKIAREDGISRSDVLRESLEDFLFVRRFRRLRQRMMAAAQTAMMTSSWRQHSPANAWLSSAAIRIF